MIFTLLLATQIAIAATKTEVQINICETQSQLEKKLDLKKWKKSEAEQTYFADNGDLNLFKRGWVFKITLEDENIKVTLKYNKATDADSEHDCEYDLHGDDRKWACRINNQMSFKEFQELQAANDLLLLLNEQQLNWLRKHSITIPWNTILTTAFRDQNFSQKVSDTKFVLGVSKNSRGTEFIELSSRADEKNEKAVQAKMHKYLKDHNINRCPNQGSIQTRLKLESFFNP
jgi:hypothetical protein